MVDRVFFIAGTVLAALGVIAGAFGAHALRARLSSDLLGVYETGVRYHLIHALALLAVAWAATRWPGKGIRLAGILFLVGIALFSGSLYALSVSGIGAFGVVTPLGGIALIAGWSILAYAVWRG